MTRGQLGVPPFPLLVVEGAAELHTLLPEPQELVAVEVGVLAPVLAKWNPGKWNQGPIPVPWWLDFRTYFSGD